MSRPFRVAIAMIVFGVAALLLSTDRGLRFLERVRFGTPSQVCVGSRSVQFSDDWLLELWYEPGRQTVQLFGLIPIPKQWTEVKSEQWLATFRSLEKEGVGVSWHVTSSKLPPEILSQNCSASTACQIRKIDVGEVLSRDISSAPVATFLIGVPSLLDSESATGQLGLANTSAESLWAALFMT